MDRVIIGCLDTDGTSGTFSEWVWWSAGCGSDNIVDALGGTEESTTLGIVGTNGGEKAGVWMYVPSDKAKEEGVWLEG